MKLGMLVTYDILIREMPGHNSLTLRKGIIQDGRQSDMYACNLRCNSYTNGAILIRFSRDM